MKPPRVAAILTASLLALSCSRAPVDPVREGNVIDYTGSGTITVDISGLPTGIVDTVTLSGPPGVQKLLLGGANPPSQTLTVTAGRYSISFPYIYVGQKYCTANPNRFSVYVSNSLAIGVAGNYTCIEPKLPT